MDGCYMGSLSGIVIVWSEQPRDAIVVDPTCSLHKTGQTDLADF
jgi:hypothetical protein